jgi:hypothetical protein
MAEQKVRGMRTNERNDGARRRLGIGVLVALLLAVLLPVVVDARTPNARVDPGGTGDRLAAGATFDPQAPPFRVRHFDLPQLEWDQLFPRGRGVPPVAAPTPVDADGVPMRLENGTLYYSPTGIAMESLRRLDAYLRTDDAAYLGAVTTWATKLRTLMVERDGALWLPFTWDDHDQGLRAPWYNALGQGSALALYARLYRLTGEPHWLETADGLFASFLQLGPSSTRPWVGSVSTAGHLWLEHYPGGLRQRVLNAHLYAAFGLRDYWQVTGSDLARLMTEAAFTTIRERGARFRRPGTWSWYNLVNRVAHPNYHWFHIRELRSAAVATGDPWFRHLADLFLADYHP